MKIPFKQFFSIFCINKVYKFTTCHHPRVNSHGNSSCMRVIKVALILVCSIMFLYKFTTTYVKPIRYIYLHRHLNVECILPNPDPFDQSVSSFYWQPKPIQCSEPLDIVYVDNNGYLCQNTTTLRRFGIKGLHCTYANVKRIEDQSVEFSQDISVSLPAYIPADFFRVICKDHKYKTIEDVLLENINYKALLKVKKIEDENMEQMSIFMFGFDSLSRLAAERSLPKTMKFMREELGAYVFKGHTKVGENTYPNLVPLLTGKPAYSEELPKYEFLTEFIDDVGFPLIYKNFTSARYVTFNAEDLPEFGMFNYLQRGFRNPPVDHYMRPAFLAMEKLKPIATNLDKVFLFLENKNINLKPTSSLCYGYRPKHKILIDYYKRFIQSYKKKRRFSFSWLTEIGHDYVSMLQLADEDTMQFFKWMQTNGHLNNTVLILLGDHGARIEAIRNTVVGRIEDKMPLLSIAIPQGMKEKYPHIHRNLQINTERLTSPYDVHEFLDDILLRRFGNQPSLLNVTTLPRGISLSREIPKRRSCFDASIPENYCACYSAKPLPLSDPVLPLIAQFVIDKLNNYLKDLSKYCAKLSLSRVIEASTLSTGLERVPKDEEFTFRKYFSKPSIDEELRYMIEIETVPGHGLFEATVSKWNDVSFKLLGDISRTNRYGNQSICISDRVLRQYCYCSHNNQI